MTDPYWTLWLSRYGDDYATLAERHAAFEQYLAAREEMRRAFEDEDAT